MNVVFYAIVSITSCSRGVSVSLFCLHPPKRLIQALNKNAPFVCTFKYDCLFVVMSSELPMGIPMRKIGTRECLCEYALFVRLVYDSFRINQCRLFFSTLKNQLAYVVYFYGCVHLRFDYFRRRAATSRI